MTELMDDPQKRESLINEGQRRAKRLLNWRNEGENLLAAYQHALAKNKPRELAPPQQIVTET
jgi:hypothetical protein